MKKFIFLLFITNYPVFCSAFSDTVELKNGTSVYCYIHEYDHDKLRISTSYSKGSYWIKTASINVLKSTSRFTFILSDGRRKLGFIKTFDSDSVSIEYESLKETFVRSEVVHFAN